MRKQSTRAFTLFELIIAIAIMVMVASTLAAAIAASFSLKSSAENAVEATRDITVAGDEFTREVRNAIQPNPNSAQDTSSASGATSTTDVPLYLAGPFIGTIDQVTFYTTGAQPRAELPSDIRYVEFGLSQKNGTTVFVERQKSNLLEDIQTDPTEEILAIDVDSVKFMYHDGTQWVDSWDSTTNGNLLPYAVGMELTLKPLQEGKPPRIIRRFAPVQCAAPATQSSDSSTGTSSG